MYAIYLTAVPEIPNEEYEVNKIYPIIAFVNTPSRDDALKRAEHKLRESHWSEIEFQKSGVIRDTKDIYPPLENPLNDVAIIVFTKGAKNI